MKKLLKIVLSVFMAMAFAIQLPVTTNAEETTSFELGASRTTIYIDKGNSTFGYLIETIDLDEDYTIEYTLSEEGIVDLEELDEAMYFNALAIGTVTITATLTTSTNDEYSDSVDISVVSYVDVIADYSMEDPNNSDCYFVYNVLSEEDKTIEIIEYYYNNIGDYNVPAIIDIPSTINGYTVVSIGEGAFIGCGDAWTITIPDTVTSIGYWAFIDCYSSTNIIVPDSVTSMSSEVFGCPMLYVYSGSYALQYAIDNNIDYTIFDAEETITFYTNLNGIEAEATCNLDDLLTEDELNNVSRVILSVADANEDVSDEEKAIIEAKLKDYVDIYYLDIILTKVVNDEYYNITEASSDITITVTIPDSLKETVGDTDGEYCIVRLHDGTAEILSDIDEDSDTVTFETDKFSIYAIAFVETTVTAEETDDTTTTTTPSSSTTTTSEESTTTSTETTTEDSTSTVSNVQTGDETKIMPYVTLAGMALLGVLYTRKKKYN